MDIDSSRVQTEAARLRAHNDKLISVIKEQDILLKKHEALQNKQLKKLSRYEKHEKNVKVFADRLTDFSKQFILKKVEAETQTDFVDESEAPATNSSLESDVIMGESNASRESEEMTSTAPTPANAPVQQLLGHQQCSNSTTTPPRKFNQIQQNNQPFYPQAMSSTALHISTAGQNVAYDSILAHSFPMQTVQRPVTCHPPLMIPMNAFQSAKMIEQRMNTLNVQPPTTQSSLNHVPLYSMKSINVLKNSGYMPDCCVCQALTLNGDHLKPQDIRIPSDMDDFAVNLMKVGCIPPYDEDLIPDQDIAKYSGVDLNMYETQIQNNLKSGRFAGLQPLELAKNTTKSIRFKEADLLARKCTLWELEHKQRIPCDLPIVVTNMMKWYRIISNLNGVQTSLLDNFDDKLKYECLHIIKHIIESKRLMQ